MRFCMSRLFSLGSVRRKAGFPRWLRSCDVYRTRWLGTKSRSTKQDRMLQRQPGPPSQLPQFVTPCLGGTNQSEGRLSRWPDLLRQRFGCAAERLGIEVDTRPEDGPCWNGQQACPIAQGVRTECRQASRRIGRATHLTAAVTATQTDWWTKTPRIIRQARRRRGTFHADRRGRRIGYHRIAVCQTAATCSQSTCQCEHTKCHSVCRSSFHPRTIATRLHASRPTTGSPQCRHLRRSHD